MKVLDVVTRSLRVLGVLAESEQPSAAQQEDAASALSALLARWELERVPSTTRPLVPTTVLGVPDAHTDAVVYGLAVRLAAEYGRPIRPDVAGIAADEGGRLFAAYPPVTTMTLEAAYLPRRWGW